jgi:hypothetical protein
VRGPGVTTSYADGVLTVTIRKAPVAAGSAYSYIKLPRGSAAWEDRPLNAQEPFEWKQKIARENAQRIMQELQGTVGTSPVFYKFPCKNTGAGYFDVFSSEITYCKRRSDSITRT